MRDAIDGLDEALCRLQGALIDRAEEHAATIMPGFTFLASIIAIFSGVQLFALGIFGEYLARIHFRTMDRPPYVISENGSTGGQTQQPAVHNE